MCVCVCVKEMCAVRKMKMFWEFDRALTGLEVLGAENKDSVCVCVFGFALSLFCSLVIVPYQEYESEETKVMIFFT